METTSSGIIPDFERCLARFLERAEKEEIEKGEAKRLFAEAFNRIMGNVSCFLYATRLRYRYRTYHAELTPKLGIEFIRLWWKGIV